MTARVRHLEKRVRSLAHGLRGHAVLRMCGERLELRGPTPMATENARHGPTTEQPFVQSMMDAVESGDTVLDLRGGSGVHAILFCRRGATRVVSVEADPMRTAFVRVNSVANGVDTRIDVVQSRVGG